ncbi:MAG: CYTH domain-containing protein [Firmicutes bacterium]|nr:CYTH domain-containing protein [Bacillota bacterium]
MATELEIRFLDIDIDALVNKLESLGAKKVGDWFYNRFIFQFPGFRYGGDERNRKWLRVRTNGEQATMTYKQIHAQTIDGTEEIEFGIDDFDAGVLFLEKLGFQKEGPQQNKRVRYMLGEVEIDIDTWPKCPPWVEVEGKTEKQIKDACKKLGLDYKKGTTQGILDILIGYGYDKDQKECRF